MSMKIKKGDTVTLSSGKDRGKKGKVVLVHRDNQTIVVEGLQLLVKHARPRRAGEKGQRVQYSRPVPMGKVALVCPKCSKPTRVGYQFTDGKKSRMCKKCKNVID